MTFLRFRPVYANCGERWQKNQGERKKEEDGNGKRRGLDSPTFPTLELFGWGARGWKLTIKMITFDDIENMRVMFRKAANRDGGGAEG
jgi:hypothetical protein